MSKRHKDKSSESVKAFWRDDRRRINKLKIPGNSKPVYRDPDTTKVITVSNEFWTGDAMWERKSGVWRCRTASSALIWMLQTPFDQIKNELLKRGCSWEWSPVSPSSASGLSGEKHESYTITSRTVARPDSHSEGRSQASIIATGETQGMEKLLDQSQHSTCANSKCSAVPTT